MSATQDWIVIGLLAFVALMTTRIGQKSVIPTHLGVFSPIPAR
jgi:hypothetical protein